MQTRKVDGHRSAKRHMVMGHMPGTEVSYVISHKIKGHKIAIQVSPRREEMKLDRSGDT